MSLGRWFRSNVRYARQLANSGLEGAGRGQEKFLQGEAVAPSLADAARQAVTPAVVGVCLAALGARLSGRPSDGRHNPARRTLAYGLLGGAIGFGAGLVWRTQ